MLLALRYPDEPMLTLAESAPAAEIFDAATVAAELERLSEFHAGSERELRLAVSRRLRTELAHGRSAIERLLIADRHGRRCAERLCAVQDEIVRVLFEFAIKHLYPAQNPSEAEHMAIVATGGYGRGVLAAGSDIDLLFLLPYKQTAWGESVAETILYCLWDMGLKVGHATRSVNECIRAAKDDMTIRTALLEARYLFGERKLYDELVARFDKEVVQGTAAEFVAAKLAEREERHSFDIQREIAVRLGYTEHPGLRDVERFMKHYFLIAKDVGDLTAILCAKLENSQAKAMPVLSRMMARFRPRARHALSETEDFVVDYNRINVADENVFKRDPVNLIRIFHLAQKYNLAFHPDAMHVATRSLRLVDQGLRENEEANRLFLEILTSKNDAETVLRRMNEAGVLGQFVPAFGRIVAMMQFNMYHHYTVDEHLLRCIGALSDIEAGRADDTKLANELMRSIQPRHRELLYVTLFLHDIAKGRIEDHSIVGARIARNLCPRLGFSPAETETGAWLIEVHLLMSSVAQSRDLSDRMTIENFSAVMQSRSEE